MTKATLNLLAIAVVCTIITVVLAPLSYATFETPTGKGAGAVVVFGLVFSIISQVAKSCGILQSFSLNSALIDMFHAKLVMDLQEVFLSWCRGNLPDSEEGALAIFLARRDAARRLVLGFPIPVRESDMEKQYSRDDMVEDTRYCLKVAHPNFLTPDGKLAKLDYKLALFHERAFQRSESAKKGYRRILENTYVFSKPLKMFANLMQRDTTSGRPDENRKPSNDNDN